MYYRIDLETLVETSKEKALKEGRVFDDVFQEKFKMLLLHYNEIISEQLLYSAYNMDWLQLDTHHRRSLLIFMERVKRPVHTMAGTIIPLSAGTFLSVNLRKSISVNPKHIHHIDKFLDACII
ncbi:hypothetical protein JYU34_004172 [Plutella xylostella]|uniref:Uncharacterized protein n=1 Tax=Plutella xylostella TaxID=51655 RepID=A0ABQ7QXA0_PLUXY|nr:hypothetical protein JYU34_004172 [Plutella xylostella]